METSWGVATGQTITGDLRSLSVDNGIVRVRYGAHALNIRDLLPITENYERRLDHVLAGRHADDPTVDAAQGCVAGNCHENGSHWHDAVYPWYGDGTAYSTAIPPTDANRIHVLLSSPEAVELAYEWDEVRLDVLRAPGACVAGRFPNCGPTSRDHEGFAVYHRGGETIKSVKSIRLWKTIRVERCTPGYYVALRSDPPLVWPEQGPRTVRLGYISTRAAWACDGSVIARHPSAGAHVDLGLTDCIADVPSQAVGHGDWPFIRILRTPRPTRMQSLQYSPAQLGSPGAFDLWDVPGRDGRPQPWQAFIGAVEYVSPDLAAEPTPEAMDLAADVSASVTW